MGSNSNVTMTADGSTYNPGVVQKSDIPSGKEFSFDGNSFAGISSLMQGFSSLGNAYTQAQAARIQGKYQAQQYDFNAKMSNIQAQDALFQGGVQAENAKKEINQVVGTERADYAASGVDVNSGSALTTQNNTQAVGAMDVLNIRNNAWRTALGYRMNAVSAGTSAGMSLTAASNQSNQTLLTGGLQAIAGSFQAGYYFGGGSGNVNRSSVSGNYGWSGGG